MKHAGKPSSEDVAAQQQSVVGSAELMLFGLVLCGGLSLATLVFAVELVWASEWRRRRALDYFWVRAANLGSVS